MSDATSPPEELEDEEESKAPWHFKLMLIALVIYLTYRLLQGIDWLIRWAF